MHGSDKTDTPIDFVQKTPQIYIDGNKVKRKDNGGSVVLKGASSDAFRHIKGKYDDPKELFRRIGILKSKGGNLITFWITLEGYSSSKELAGEVVDFADNNGMYILFAPAQMYSENWDEQRFQLMTELAKRFRDKTNIIYGLDAEPFQDWLVVVGKATELGKEIRLINPDSILLLPGSWGGREIGQRRSDKFTLDNTIFGVEDYLAADAKSLKVLQSKKDYRENYSWQDPAYLDFPILVTEMGGTWGADFGSEEDLAVIKRMLDDVEARGFNYQMHSLDTYDEWMLDGVTKDITGLGLFDGDGNLTKKGDLYFNFLSEHPGTKIK